MNYPAASYGVSKDNMFCHSVLDTESREWSQNMIYLNNQLAHPIFY